MKLNLTKKQYLEAKAHIKRTNNACSAEFLEIPESDWPFEAGDRTRVWRNWIFLVQEFTYHDHVRLSINRAKILRNGDWSDKISWEELMDIKRAVGYGMAWAYECFPPDTEVVNLANMRHLFIMNKDPMIGWRES